MLCNRRILHRWGAWTPGAIINVVDDLDHYKKTAMWRQCAVCGWIATKEVYGTYQEVSK